MLRMVVNATSPRTPKANVTSVLDHQSVILSKYWLEHSVINCKREVKKVKIE